MSLRILFIVISFDNDRGHRVAFSFNNITVTCITFIFVKGTTIGITTHADVKACVDVDISTLMSRALPLVI
jgi:hypothetical protein